MVLPFGAQLLWIPFLIVGMATTLMTADLIQGYTREKLMDLLLSLAIFHVAILGLYWLFRLSIRRQEARGETTEAGGLSTTAWRVGPVVTYVAGAAMGIVMAFAGY